MKPVLQQVNTTASHSLQQSESQHTAQRKDEVKWEKISINNLNTLIVEKYSTGTIYVF
jgi:hypothetical protein